MKFCHDGGEKHLIYVLLMYTHSTCYLISELDKIVSFCDLSMKARKCSLCKTGWLSSTLYHFTSEICESEWLNLALFGTQPLNNT